MGEHCGLHNSRNKAKLLVELLRAETTLVHRQRVSLLHRGKPGKILHVADQMWGNYDEVLLAMQIFGDFVREGLARTAATTTARTARHRIQMHACSSNALLGERDGQTAYNPTCSLPYVRLFSIPYYYTTTSHTKGLPYPLPNQASTTRMLSDGSLTGHWSSIIT